MIARFLRLAISCAGLANGDLGFAIAILAAEECTHTERVLLVAVGIRPEQVRIEKSTRRAAL